eukprot:1162081-Pelagomonas_calceolata.AAC.4
MDGSTPQPSAPVPIPTAPTDVTDSVGMPDAANAAKGDAAAVATNIAGEHGAQAAGRASGQVRPVALPPCKSEDCTSWHVSYNASELVSLQLNTAFYCAEGAGRVSKRARPVALSPHEAKHCAGSVSNTAIKYVAEEWALFFLSLSMSMHLNSASKQTLPVSMLLKSASTSKELEGTSRGAGQDGGNCAGRHCFCKSGWESIGEWNFRIVTKELAGAVKGMVPATPVFSSILLVF